MHLGRHLEFILLKDTAKRHNNREEAKDRMNKMVADKEGFSLVR